jgi:hypothetical protein
LTALSEFLVAQNGAVAAAAVVVTGDQRFLVEHLNPALKAYGGQPEAVAEPEFMTTTPLRTTILEELVVGKGICRGPVIQLAVVAEPQAVVLMDRQALRGRFFPAVLVVAVAGV